MILSVLRKPCSNLLCTYAVVEGVAVPIPCLEKLGSAAVCLGPGVAICHGGVKSENSNAECQENDCTGLSDNGTLTQAESTETSSDKVVDLAHGDDGEVESWEVVVQEKLSLHQEEGEVVEGPPENVGADLVVETLEGDVAVILESALPSQNSETLDGDVQHNSQSRAPPNDRVTDEVNLTVVLAPEVDTTTKDRPRLRARVPSVRLDQAGVCGPHDLLEFPELTEEARVAVVDLFGVGLQLRVLVALNIPHAVGKSCSLGAGDFLLFETPVWELDLVGEENTASHDVDKLELGLNGTDALLCCFTIGQRLDNLDLEKVVGVTFESFVTISRNLVLPVGVSYGRAVVVGVNAAGGSDMVETNDGSIFHVARVNSVPGHGSLDVFAVDVERLGLVLKEPDVVLILVGVQGDLLLLATGGVHVAVRVEVTTLSVVMTERNTRTESDISSDTLHALAVESRLELGRHETITIARVDKADEVDGEHAHVEGDGDDDQAEDASKQVLEPDTRCDSAGVGEENPELESSETADPSDCEESDPFDTGGGTKGETGRGEPEPPGWLESSGRALLVLVGE